MGLITHIVTGSIALAGARAYAVALQGRPLFEKKLGYAIWTAAGAYIGYEMFQFRERSEARIERRYKELLEQRDMRRATEQELEQE